METAQGMILGTAAVMSPEQARGIAVDYRTDIWAFGVVLYQMLTGREAFEGELVSDILASILARDPDYTLLPPGLHPRLREMLERCLEKDRNQRWQAIGDVRIEIEHALDADPAERTASTITAPRQGHRRWTLAIASIAIVVAALAWWLFKVGPGGELRPLVRFDYELPNGQVIRNAQRGVVAMSPDGSRFVYNTNQGLY